MAACYLRVFILLINKAINVPARKYSNKAMKGKA